METIFTQYGITGLIAFLLYVYMKNGFRQTEKLIDNIKEMSEGMNKIVLSNTEKRIVTDNVIADMKRLYEQNNVLLKDIEKLIISVDNRTSLCPNIDELMRQCKAENKSFSER